MQEQTTLPWEQPVITRDEVTGGMGLIMAGILNNIDAKAAGLGLERDQKVTDATDELTMRSLILINGIRKNTKSNRLQGFLNRSAGLHELSNLTLRDFVNDRDSLIDKIRRFSIAIQGDMNIHGLITEKSKRQLAESGEKNSSAAG